VPFGAAIGQRALLIETEDDETSTESIVDSFKNAIKEFEKEYYNALNGSHSVFFILTGRIIENAFAKQLEELCIGISKEAVTVQKTLKLTPDKIKPPFLVWAGNPIEMSSIRQKTGDAYQYFNVVYILLNGKTDYNAMGLQQMLNHNFSMLCIKDDILFLNHLKRKFNLTNKVCLISSKDHEKAQKECLTNAYRYYPHFDSDLVLKLIKEE
jgi:hypothetical protein